MSENLFYKAVGEIDSKFIENFEAMESKSKRVKNKWLLPLVALIPVFITVCYAAGLSTGVVGFLGINNSNDISYLTSKSYYVDEIIEGDTGTIHIKEVIGDDNLTYIFFDFIAPEDVILDNDFYQFEYNDFNFHLSSIDSMIFLVHSIEDDDNMDNKISFICHLNTAESLQGENLEFFFKDLYGYDILDDDTSKSSLICEGIWESKPIKLDFKTISNSYAVNEKFSQGDFIANLEKINISPIAITISGVIENASDDVRKNEFTVHYEDGTNEMLFGSGGYSTEDYKFVYTCEFLPILDKQIVAVTYLGQRIELIE